MADPEDFDEIDRRIFGELRKNPRVMTSAMSRSLKLPEPTVRRRLKRLLDDGLVQMTARLDPNRTGYSVQAYIGLEVNRSHIELIAARMAGYDFIQSTSIVTGPSHILAYGNFRNIDALYEFVMHELGNVEGISNTRTFVVLKDFSSS
jgi:Lrp/AsnC family transcriptional regulator for asnA, asnC and gidA